MKITCGKKSVELVEFVEFHRQGQHVLCYGRDIEGWYYRTNPKGNWVRLDLKYPQHAKLVGYAKSALRQAKGGA